MQLVQMSGLALGSVDARLALLHFWQGEAGSSTLVVAAEKAQFLSRRHALKTAARAGYIS